MGDPNVNQWELLQKAVRESIAMPPGSLPSLGTMANYSFLLPSKLGEQHARNSIVDEIVKGRLESKGLINWCSTIKHLLPVQTKGDGNCLLHAVSLYLWGLHDTEYLLRRLISAALKSCSDQIRPRWQQQCEKECSSIPGGLCLSAEQWESYWSSVLTLVSDSDQMHPVPHVSCLESIHVFVTANVLRRPVIVYGEPFVHGVDGSTFSPNHLVGVYLPLLSPAAECMRTPVLLTVDNGHFMPLLSTAEDEQQPSALAISSVHGAPLVQPLLEPLKIHFMTAEEERRVTDLFHSYLNLDEVPLTTSDSVLSILYARLIHKKLPAYLRAPLPQPPSSIAWSTPQVDTSSQPSSVLSSNSVAGKRGSVTLPENSSATPSSVDANHEQGLRPEDLVALNMTSLSGDLCRTARCPFYSSVYTYPFCRICASEPERGASEGTRIGASSDTSNQTAAISANAVNERAVTQGLPDDKVQSARCLTVGCNSFTMASADFLCASCSQHQKVTGISGKACVVSSTAASPSDNAAAFTVSSSSTANKLPIRLSYVAATNVLDIVEYERAITDPIATGQHTQQMRSCMPDVGTRVPVTCARQNAFAGGNESRFTGHKRNDIDTSSVAASTRIADRLSGVQTRVPLPGDPDHVSRAKNCEASAAVLPLVLQTVDARKCIHPKCANSIAGLEFGGLCQECYDVICAHKLQQSPPKVLDVQLCNYRGCDTIGHPSLGGLCQKHYPIS